ncbi:MAG: HAD-IIIA family hydrolase [Saccharospirillaceae bacterium]|nr:HAD-IIIA family hydrolase [Pseudomonadales bacterium]NRB80293.1 HAD-IIIA family hydrolase [Saccharospirillaceae bacterium]
MLTQEKLSNIKLAIFDVDGVLTDGKLYYSEHSELIKVFNVKDGVAFKLLPVHGVEVAVISAKTSKPLITRLKDLNVSHAYLGIKDKLTQVTALCAQLKLNMDQVAYVGDDMVDYAVLERVGVSFMPADGYHLLESICDKKLNSKGGDGVAREVCDLILSSKGGLLDFYQIAKKDGFTK